MRVLWIAMLGCSRSEFLVWLEAHLRKVKRHTGMSPDEWAKDIGELTHIVDLVRRNKCDPTKRMLDNMGWVSIVDTYMAYQAIEETRYMRKDKCIQHEI